MTTTTVMAPDAVALIDAAKPILTRGDWGDGVTAVCFMRALVPWAKEEEDCMTAGWPEWLVTLCIDLFDADVLEYGGEEANDVAAIEWAESMALALSQDADYERVKHTFLDELLAACADRDGGDVIERARRVLQFKQDDPGYTPDRHNRVQPHHPMDLGEVATYVMTGAAAAAAECLAELFSDESGIAAHLAERARQRQSLVDAIATSRDGAAA